MIAFNINYFEIHSVISTYLCDSYECHIHILLSESITFLFVIPLIFLWKEDFLPYME